MPTYATEIMRVARSITRLQSERRRLRKRLRAIDQELRHDNRTMRALLQAKDDAPQAPPLRVFGEAPAGVPKP